MINLKKLLIGAGVLASLALQGAGASEVTLRLHQFLPQTSSVPAMAITPWIEKVERESGGRIKVQHFPLMQAGGTPPQLFDQARDGVVDIIWTALGYTPGRFPRSEVFELPFMANKDAEKSSLAFHEYVTAYAMEEFKDVKLLAAHVNGPGVLHTKTPVRTLDDLKGMRVRGASRIVNITLEQLGAVPVGMPAPAVSEALSKGVITATSLQWEVVPALRIQQMVKNHTITAGDRGLYTGTFAFVMNKSTYEKLPADLKKVIDNNSGANLAALFGKAMNEGDKRGIDAVKKEGNTIITLDAAETAQWQRATSRVRAMWYQEVGKRGINGDKLAAEADALIAKHSK